MRSMRLTGPITTETSAVAMISAITVLARLRRQDFRIVQALGDAVGIEDHGSDHDRPGPWPAPGLVDAGDRSAKLVHQRRFEIEARRGLWFYCAHGESHGWNFRANWPPIATRAEL